MTATRRVRTIGDRRVRAGVVVGAVVMVLSLSGIAAASTDVPSGQRRLGDSVVEPVYDAAHPGVVGFVKTPSSAPIAASPRAWAPLYLPVYPTGSTVGALICPHLPVDGCPDHGPVIAELARNTVPAVYGEGVIGHDHLAVLRTEGGFHVALEPIVVLFTSTAAANDHLLTSQAVLAAVARGDAITIPLPGAVLHGEQVSERVWSLATPID
jgi:hypothetical protein